MTTLSTNVIIMTLVLLARHNLSAMSSFVTSNNVHIFSYNLVFGLGVGFKSLFWFELMFSCLGSYLARLQLC